MAADDNPLWYKDAVIYELHVRAFMDSDADGIGDFRGLASKLDYLQDLGVTALWLLPFYPSPLKDDGYDIADYTGIHSSYGRLADFKFFLKEAHRRGLKIITELVLNHTSYEHPWFKRARRAAPGSKERNYYVWSDQADRYKEARVIFKDFESSNWTWDSAAKAYYWHRFYSHQPDLNFDHPAVRKGMFEVLGFWLAMGVDGLRLDAVPYLFEREGTSCENLPETHAYLKEIRSKLDRKFKGRMLLAEANQWPEDAVAYFGEGDECHMAFHFPIMPRLFMAIHMEDRFPIIDILQQTPAIPDSCQWAVFLRNHDELTLEMVTDEERDYMYRVYAKDPNARINLGIRRRLAPLLGNHRRKIELMNGLLFSLPGTPVIYYGDELGMGDNIYLGDRNGVRTPMQWSADRNAGFSRANPQRLFLPVSIEPGYHYESVNVETQQANPHSLLWWMKRVISLRKRYRAFSRGTVQFLSPSNSKVLAFVRQYEEERILVVANLSRFVQYAEMDLSSYKGMVPVEIFGSVEFPPIGDLPYFVTLGPHSFYWFSLEMSRTAETGPAIAEGSALRKIRVTASWENVFRREGREPLEKVLPEFLRRQRWFAGKAQKIKRVEIVDQIAPPRETLPVNFLLVKVEYADSEPERYQIPLAFAPVPKAFEIQQNNLQSAVAWIQIRDKSGDSEGILYDAFTDRDFCVALLDAVKKRRVLKGQSGNLEALPTPLFKKSSGGQPPAGEPSVLKGEQSNTSVIYGDRYIFKFFRRIQDGVNPELEMGSYLSLKTGFSGIPAALGSIEYRRPKTESAVAGILQAFVPNEGDAWQYTLDALDRYFEKVLIRPGGLSPAPVLDKNPLELSLKEADPLAAEMVNPYLETARLLGQRTAELHAELSRETEDPAFIPEPFSPFYQRATYQSLRNLFSRVFQTLRSRLKTLPDPLREDAKSLLDLEAETMARIQWVRSRKMTAMRIRYHGDYHLGQVLFTGKDFVIIDFEGEPARNLQERRVKRCPLVDVAGMVRSFHYAAHTALRAASAKGKIAASDLCLLEPWADFWYGWTSSAFLRAYRQTAGNCVFLPGDETELSLLFETFLLEKAIYELGYELNNRPDWAHLPIKGIRRILTGTNH